MEELCKIWSIDLKNCANASLNSWSIFDWDKKQSKLEKLKKESEGENFWQDNKNAQQVMKDISDIQSEMELWNGLSSQVNDFLDLAASGDESFRE